MQEVISTHVAKSTLSKPVPVDATDKPARVVGFLKGQINLPDDLEAPLPDDVIRLFEGTD